MDCLGMIADKCSYQLPGWDPIWSRILAVHISTFLAGRRCHGTLGVGRFDPSLTVGSFVATLHFLEVIKKYDASEIALFIKRYGYY